MAKKISSFQVEYHSDFEISSLTVDPAFNVGRTVTEYDPEKCPEMAALVASIKARGFAPDEAILVSRVEGSGEAEYLLDAGFRRVAAAKLAGIKLIPALIYATAYATDPVRRERNATENATVAPTWQGQAGVCAALSAAGFKPGEIASRLACHRDHVGSLIRTHARLTELVKREIIPAEKIGEISLSVARELCQFPDEADEGNPKTVVVAWNAFAKTGKLPSREPKSGGRGSSGAGGGDWNRKKGLAVLQVHPGVRAFPFRDFDTLYPPKSEVSLKLCVEMLLKWQRGEYVATEETITSEQTGAAA